MKKGETPTPAASTFTDPEWERLWSIFHEALEIEEHERVAWVAEACGGDAGLRHRVEELLAAHASSDHLLDRPPVWGELSEPSHLQPGQTVGVYRILELIGEGGMGAVYRAEQLEPVCREVALKVIKLGMDTREVVARFERERQALAVMSHPNIAVALDAGATAEGRPYFAMELVEGVPFTSFCDDHELSVRERLELFVDVCRGVHHAHQKGIVHRDLKPSNTLVAQEDGVALPKVIDFGVAKAIDPPGSDGGRLTSSGGRVGTPAYMSPEQREGTGADIDTRSDIYSLGIFLFELLTGVLPHARSVEGSPAEKFSSNDPPTTSDVLSGLASEKAEEAARRRGTSRERLTREIRGDLDWIVAKAMANGRDFRYASAAELAADIERHLRSEPVLAGPPSALYRFGKLVRRHRLAFVVALLAGALAIALGISLAVSSVRLRQALQEAEEEKTRAEAVTDFLVKSFEVSDPQASQGRSLTAREVLDQGASRIDEELAGEPELRLRLMEVIASVYSSLGLSADAVAQLERVAAERRQQESASGLLLATSLHALGTELARVGDYAAAQQALEEALELRRSAGGNHRPEVGGTLHELGTLALRRGDLEVADDLLSEALVMRRAELGPDQVEVGKSLNNLGALRMAQGRYEAAIELHREALEIRRRIHGGAHSDVAASLNNMARALEGRGEVERAAELHRESLEIWRQTLGDSHPRIASSLTNLANLSFRSGEVERAFKTLRQAEAILSTALGEDHPTTLDIRHNLGEMLFRSGRSAEAEVALKAVLEDKRRVLPEKHPRLAETLVILGRLRDDDGRMRQAEELLREALEIRRARLPEGHPQTAITLRVLGRNLIRQKDFAAAEELLLESWEALSQRPGGAHERALTGTGLVDLYASWGRLGDEALWLRRARASAGGE